MWMPMIHQEMNGKTGFILVFLGSAFILGCGSDLILRNAGLEPVPIGPWGGRGIALEVGFTDSTAKFDCAQGTIDEAFMADKNGEFNLQGTFTLGKPGPSFPDEPEDSQPARLWWNSGW